MKIKITYLFLCLSQLVMAQNREGSFRMGIDLGVSREYKYFAQMGLTLQFEKDYYKTRIAGAYNDPSRIQKETYKQDKNCNCMEAEGVTDLGFIYGRSFPFSKHQRIQFGSGISVITRTEPDELYNATKAQHELDKYLVKHTVGLPFEAKYGFEFYRKFEFIASMNLNVNTLQNYSSISLGIAAPIF